MSSSELRRQTGVNEIALIVITLLPFASGYMYSHGTLQSISFVSNNIDLIHTITGEMFIVTAAFLFLKIDLDKEKCIGCSACVFVCPTHTLQSNDISEFRYFYYNHSQCISCGTCILYCPESATALHHEISLNRLVKPMPSKQIFDVKLAQCPSCGVFFAPERQMAKLGELKVVDQVLSLCPRCRAVRANASCQHLKDLRESRRSRRSA
jgi:formate hydrogenlyase subunit 6/NADH:ubiquinone oxidoreductase subunit I